MAAFLQIALLFFFVFFVFAFLRGLIEGFSGKTLEWDFRGMISGADYDDEPEHVQFRNHDGRWVD